MKVDHTKAIDWIRNNWIKPTACPICGSDNWGIGDEIIEVRSSSPESPIYPQFFVYCQKCGHTIFFNAVIAGLVELKPKPIPPKNLRII
jgi:predicted nucleic-acid-binding Zn-ribbon protein